ncbi:hypothetical protein Tco_0904944 [Tanacetum coccineum]
MPLYEEKPLLLAKRKVTHHGDYWTSQSGMLHSGGLTSEVRQGKDGGLASLPPYKNTQRNPCGRSMKVQTATPYARERDQPKLGKKEVSAKDKSMEIYMIQPWHRVTRQKVTQSFERVREITFPSLTTSSGTKSPLVIEAEIGRHMIHRMYVDRGSSKEVLYEHCFNQLRPEIKNQMVPTTTSLTGFSGETIWPLGQLRLLVTIGDVDHSTKVWMNFIIVRSLSPYNGIIGRPGIRDIKAVPSTAHEMLKKKKGEAPDRAKAIQAERNVPGLVDKAFNSQVGRNIEVYVDDLVIKSHAEAKMLRDIDETFQYEALIAGLRIAVQMGVRNVQVLVEILKEKSIQEKEVEAIVDEEGPIWMTSIIEYLKDGTLAGDRKEASKLQKRKRAAIYEAKAKLKMTKYYNARVRGVTFRPGDFVYRSNDASHVVAGGKLGPKWEGPYEVTEALGDGAYRLRSIDGAVLPRT